MRAALLAALQMADVRLIAYGLPGKALPESLADCQEQLVVSNGALLPGSTVVLTACHATSVAALTSRFLVGDARLGENLALLRQIEGIVVAAGDTCFVS